MSQGQEQPSDPRSPTTVVKQHYEDWFDWFDRGELARDDQGELEAPIMNIGYWKDEREDVRQAQVAMVNLLASRMPDLAGSRVLDAGCGVGGPAIILARDHGAQVDGVNIVERQLGMARQYIHGAGLDRQIRLYVADAMQLPFRDGSFDFVFNLEMAHCLANKGRFLGEVRRVLRPGGRLVMVDIIATSRTPVIRYQPALRLNLLTAKEWRRALGDSGLVLEEQAMIGGDVYPQLLRWANRTAGERRARLYRWLSRDEKAHLPPWVRRRQAWAMELALCRSVLPVGGVLKLRGYVLQVARKPPAAQTGAGREPTMVG